MNYGIQEAMGEWEPFENSVSSSAASGEIKLTPAPFVLVLVIVFVLVPKIVTPHAVGSAINFDKPILLCLHVSKRPLSAFTRRADGKCRKLKEALTQCTGYPAPEAKNESN